MIIIKLLDCRKYQNEPNGTRKDEIRQIILDAMLSGSYGRKKMLKECNNDPDEVIKRTYKGFETECKVLKHLQEKNPEQGWHFIDPYAGYFKLDCETITNDPDLINSFGTTVEVKRTKLKEGIFYFDKDLNDNDKFWHYVAHDADYLVIVDSTSESKCIIITKEDLNKMKCYQNPWHKEKMTWEITGDIREL